MIKIQTMSVAGTAQYLDREQTSSAVAVRISVAAPTIAPTAEAPAVSAVGAVQFRDL